MRESAYAYKITSRLIKEGLSAYRVETGSTALGFPDIHAFSPRIVPFWIETKVIRKPTQLRDGALRPAQRTWHEAARRSGIYVPVLAKVIEAGIDFHLFAVDYRAYTAARVVLQERGVFETYKREPWSAVDDPKWWLARGFDNIVSDLIQLAKRNPHHE